MSKQGRRATDYTSISLVDARRDYLATSTTGMPIAGLVAWGGLALGYWLAPEGIRVASRRGCRTHLCLRHHRHAETRLGSLIDRGGRYLTGLWLAAS